jgi:hypothetical protein
MAKAITDVIAEARLAYAFCPGSYTMSALNAVLAVEQRYICARRIGRRCISIITTPAGSSSDGRTTRPAAKTFTG